LSTADRVLGIGRTLSAAARLGAHRARAVGYIGWLGYENLGDDVMYLAVAERLGAVPLPPLSSLLASHRLRPAIGRIVRQRVAVLMLGGGTQFCNRGWRREIEGLERWTGPLPLLPLGAGVDIGTHQSESPSAWAAIFERCDRVTVRGPRSQRHLAESGITSEIVGDTALLVEPPPRPLVRPGTIGINVGPVDPVPVSEARLVEIAEAVAREASTKGYEPVWIAAIPEDLPLLREARERAGSGGRVLESFRNPIGFAGEVAWCEAVVTAKLHVGVLAALSGVPIVSLAYEQKCADFAESIDCLDAVVELVDDDTVVGTTLDRFRDLERDLDTWSRRTRAGVAALRPRLLARFHEVQLAIEDATAAR
jgi:hypothetical protein